MNSQYPAMRPFIVLNRRSDYNMALHGQFLSSCEELGIHAVFWGPAGAGVKGLQYEPRTTVTEAAKQYGCNVILLYRAQENDLEPLRAALDMTNREIPAVLVDVDFWRRRNRTRGDLHRLVDLHLLRHPSDVAFSRAGRKDTLPLSVDPDIYRLAPQSGREGICFSGAWHDPVYAVRVKAANLVEAERPISRVMLADQASFYGRHLAAITCGCAHLHYLTGKHFEIAATGTVLFTDGNNGIEQYLPEGTYVRYRSDCSDVVSLWAQVSKNRDEWLCRACKAAAHVREHHSHMARWRDLLERLERHLGCRWNEADRNTQR